MATGGTIDDTVVSSSIPLHLPCEQMKNQGESVCMFVVYLSTTNFRKPSLGKEFLREVIYIIKFLPLRVLSMAFTSAQGTLSFRVCCDD